VNATSLGNAGLDVRADEAAAGAGVLSLSNVAYGTAGGDVVPTILD
jgi:hypothetical protein